MLGMGRGGGEGQRLACLPHYDLLNLSKMAVAVLSVVQSNTKRKELQTWTCKSKETDTRTQHMQKPKKSRNWVWYDEYSCQ